VSSEDLLRRYRKAKEAVEAAERELQRAEGRLEQLKEQLREFGCESVAEARKKLAELEKEQRRLTKKLSGKLEEFQAKWNDLMRD